MSDRDRLYLEHIFDCVLRIQSYAQPGKATFFEQTIMQDAIVRNLQLIGESSKRVSPELQASENRIPWKAVVGLRNVLVHDYLGVDLVNVWRIVEEDLPDLRRELELALRNPD